MRGVAWLILSCLATLAQADVESAFIVQTSPLAGFQYHAGRALFPLLNEGDRLKLIREPDNPYDAKAIRVEWRGVMIGFAPRIDNVDLARLMDNGMQVEGRIVALQRSRDPWKRILFDVLAVEHR